LFLFFFVDDCWSKGDRWGEMNPYIKYTQDILIKRKLLELDSSAQTRESSTGYCSRLSKIIVEGCSRGENDAKGIPLKVFCNHAEKGKED